MWRSPTLIARERSWPDWITSPPMLRRQTHRMIQDLPSVELHGVLGSKWMDDVHDREESSRLSPTRSIEVAKGALLEIDELRRLLQRGDHTQEQIDRTNSALGDKFRVLQSSLGFSTVSYLPDYTPTNPSESPVVSRRTTTPLKTRASLLPSLSFQRDAN